ncbi:MAG: dihydrofolate reductase, partial [Planctomycetota bacterium]
MKRNLTYFVACSVDGFIAREDGSIGDFSFDGSHVADILEEFPETIPTHLRQYFDAEYTNKRFDTVLMGRATYETGLDAGFTSPYTHLD